MSNDLELSLKQVIKEEIRKELYLSELTRVHEVVEYYGWILRSHNLEDEIHRELHLRILDYLKNKDRITFQSFYSRESKFEDIDDEYKFVFICNNNLYSIIYYFYDEPEGRFVKINIYKNDNFLEKMEFNIEDFMIEVVLSNINRILYGE